jgi:hypothetical protein
MVTDLEEAAVLPSEELARMRMDDREREAEEWRRAAEARHNGHSGREGETASKGRRLGRVSLRLSWRRRAPEQCASPVAAGC